MQTTMIASNSPRNTNSLTTSSCIASLRAFKPANRVNQALTAAVEKRALVWMAERAPRWVTSDRLTMLGLTAQILAGVFYGLARYNRWSLLAVIVCIALNWLGDSLDGTLARVRQQQRPRFGFYVDHMVDVFGAVALLCGLGCSGFVHWQVAVAMLVAFLLLSSESYLATYTLSHFQLSMGIFGPTELRILLIIGNIALLHSPFASIFGHRMLLFDLGGAMGASGMFAIAILLTLRHTAQLYAEEPLA